MNYRLPENAVELLLDDRELILGVVNIVSLRDYLSGCKKTEPFCVFTDERFYYYQAKKSLKADVYDIEDIKKASVTTMKSRIKSIEVLFAIPFGLLAFLMYKLSVNSLYSDILGALGVVFFMIDALIFAVAGIYCLFHGTFSRTARSVVHIYTCDSKDLRISLPVLDSITVKRIEHCILDAKRARYSEFPELFLY